MPSIPLSIRAPPSSPLANGLPQLLQTPSGLALLEIQGTVHFPPPPETDPSVAASTVSPTETHIGTLVFPLYDPAKGAEGSDPGWMKRVYMYVGKHQRMRGEVKKLPKPLGVICRKQQQTLPIGTEAGDAMDLDEGGAGGEALELVEVVKWKIVFTERPEPVGEGEGI